MLNVEKYLARIELNPCWVASRINDIPTVRRVRRDVLPVRPFDVRPQTKDARDARVA